MDIREVNNSELFEVEINDWWANARYRELKKSIPLKEKSNLVDIGCGSAQNLLTRLSLAFQPRNRKYAPASL